MEGIREQHSSLSQVVGNPLKIHIKRIQKDIRETIHKEEKRQAMVD